MLGELIGEGRGKRTGRRVLATDPQFNVEVSFEDSGKLLDVEGMNIGTYTSHNRPDGTLAGEGKGVFAGRGGELATWIGIGINALVSRVA